LVEIDAIYWIPCGDVDSTREIGQLSMRAFHDKELPSMPSEGEKT
jgi:hypothetical protein